MGALHIYLLFTSSSLFVSGSFSSSTTSPRAPRLNSFSIDPKLRPSSGSLLGPNNSNAAITSSSKWVGRNKFSSTIITPQWIILKLYTFIKLLGNILSTKMETILAV
ncbi:hypothetical protein D3C73_658510 [compost metagenome]